MKADLLRPSPGFTWVGGSLVVHVLLLLALYLLAPNSPREELKSLGTPLEVKTLTRQEFETLYKASLDKGQKRVVESEAAVAKNPVTRANYLGEHTRRAETETRARDFGSTEGGDSENFPGEPGGSSNPQSQKTLKNLTALAPIFKDNVDNGSKGGLKKGSADDPGRNLPIGPRTLLNTDEYIYASFFNRIKREIAPRWDYQLQHQRDRWGKLGSNVYMTVINAFLDDAGQVQRVEVLQSSGVTVFDDVARDVFWEIKVFANPPKALQEPDGWFRVRMSFSVDVNATGVNVEYLPDPRFDQTGRPPRRGSR